MDMPSIGGTGPGFGRGFSCALKAKGEIKTANLATLIPASGVNHGKIKPILETAQCRLSMNQHQTKIGRIPDTGWGKSLKNKGGDKERNMRSFNDMAASGERDTVGGDRKSSSQGAIMKLADLGITLSLSSRWQLSGTVSDEDYRAWLDGLKGETFPTSSALRNLAKRQTV